MALKYAENVNFNKLDHKLQNLCTVLSTQLEDEVIVTSGLRTPEHNAEVNGVKNSSHLRGLAVDLACNTSAGRYKIIFHALASGFKRIGVGSDHIHLDIDKEKVSELIFLEP